MSVVFSSISFVTHKEIMRLWNITEYSAKKRLWEIRVSLAKKRKHKLTVEQFCLAEDITVEDFYKKVK